MTIDSDASRSSWLEDDDGEPTGSVLQASSVARGRGLVPLFGFNSRLTAPPSNETSAGNGVSGS